MEFTRATAAHAAEAAKLAYKEYEREREHVPALPEYDFEEALSKSISVLFEKGFGMVATEGGEMKGYLAYWINLEGYFGGCKGAYSPLHGCAIGNADKEKLISMLFERVSGELVKSGHTSYAMTRYAHDTASHNALTLCGFGIRCADSVRLTDIPLSLNESPEIRIARVAKEDMEALYPLHGLLSDHLHAPPVYFPTIRERAMKSFLSQDRRTFAAYTGDKPIGYIQLTDEGENFITDIDGMQSICGMIFYPEARGTGAAAKLLSHVVDVVKSEGSTYLGVDCETLNPTALRFWGKYFTPYTYSYHRRIDERALD